MKEEVIKEVKPKETKTNTIKLPEWNLEPKVTIKR